MHGLRAATVSSLLALSTLPGCYGFRRSPLPGTVDVPATEAGPKDVPTAEVAADAGVDACAPACGSRCEPCPAPADGRATCVMGACGVACDPGYTLRGSACARVAAPHLIAPLSSSTVTSHRPTLRWVLDADTDAAHVELCRDRACATVVGSADVAGPSWSPSAELPVGVYYWRAAGRRGGVTGTSWTPVWEFFVTPRSSPTVDRSYGATLDLNGDGYADLAIGAPEAAGGAGRAYVYLGGPSGIRAEPSVVLTPGDSLVRFLGAGVTSVGDLNGDGYADLGVGAPRSEAGVGRAYFYAGGPAGPRATPDWVLVGTGTTDTWFGFAIGAPGDTDGDGYADVAVTTYRVGNYRGQVFYFRGGPRGPELRPSLTHGGTAMLSQFGQTFAGGDVNGDGYGDLVVGEQGWMNYAGRMLVFLGSPTGLGADPATVIDGYPGTFGRAGLADVNGDGYADALSTAYSSPSPGRGYAFHGGAGGVAPTASTTISGPGSPFGVMALGVGDVNADGYEDVVVAGDDPTHAGSEHLFLGGAGGLAVTPAASWSSTDGAGSNFGYPAAELGDLNGDHVADFAVAAHRAGGGLGRVYVYLGRAGALPAAPMTLAAPEGGAFGVSMTSVH